MVETGTREGTKRGAPTRRVTSRSRTRTRWRAGGGERGRGGKYAWRPVGRNEVAGCTIPLFDRVCTILYNICMAHFTALRAKFDAWDITHATSAAAHPPLPPPPSVIPAFHHLDRFFCFGRPAHPASPAAAFHLSGPYVGSQGWQKGGADLRSGLHQPSAPSVRNPARCAMPRGHPTFPLSATVIESPSLRACSSGLVQRSFLPHRSSFFLLAIGPHPFLSSPHPVSPLAPYRPPLPPYSYSRPRIPPGPTCCPSMER